MAFEARPLGELYVEMAKEFDIPRRIEIKSQIADYLHYEALVIGDASGPQQHHLQPELLRRVADAAERGRKALAVPRVHPTAQVTR